MRPDVQNAIGKGKEADSPLGLWDGQRCVPLLFQPKETYIRLCPLELGRPKSVEIHRNRELTHSSSFCVLPPPMGEL